MKRKPFGVRLGYAIVMASMGLMLFRLILTWLLVVPFVENGHDTVLVRSTAYTVLDGFSFAIGLLVLAALLGIDNETWDSWRDYQRTINKWRHYAEREGTATEQDPVD